MFSLIYLERIPAPDRGHFIGGFSSLDLASDECLT